MKLNKLASIGVAILALTMTRAWAEEAGNAEGYGKPRGALGNITVGPQLTLVSIPGGIRFGVESKYDNLIGIGLEYGFIPSVTLNSVALSLNSFQGTAKIYPYKGALHLGFALGSRNFTGSTPVSVSGTPVTITGTASTFYLTPTVGWKWVYESGFYWGMDFGWQIALSNTSAITTDPSTTAANSTSEYTQVNDALTNIGRASLPSMTLLQIGYLF